MASLFGKNNPFYGKHHTRKTKNKLSKICGRFGRKNGFYGKRHSEETKKKISTLMKGRKLKNRSLTWRKKLSNALKGRPKSEQHKKNIGIASKSRIMNRKINQGILKIGYNKNACKYFNKLNKEMRWNLIHAENGGEVKCGNYLLDAYDKQRNIVVEYDEKHHYDISGKLKQKDIERMGRIISLLKCSFYRFNETSQLLIKVI